MLWDDFQTVSTGDADDTEFLAQRRESLRETAATRKRQQQAKRAKGAASKVATAQRTAVRSDGLHPHVLRRSGRPRKPSEKAKVGDARCSAARSSC